MHKRAAIPCMCQMRVAMSCTHCTSTAACTSVAWPTRLQVLDAKTMSPKPVAKVKLPQRVPLGFHGTFIYQEQLKLQQPQGSM
jgi:hypothetical protein